MQHICYFLDERARYMSFDCAMFTTVCTMYNLFLFYSLGACASLVAYNQGKILFLATVIDSNGPFTKIKLCVYVLVFLKNFFTQN